MRLRIVCSDWLWHYPCTSLKFLPVFICCFCNDAVKSNNINSEEHNAEAVVVQFSPNSAGSTEHAHTTKNFSEGGRFPF
jgi:hypothetical protein